MEKDFEKSDLRARMYGFLLYLILFIMVAEVAIVYWKFFVYEPPFKVGRFPPGYVEPSTPIRASH